MYICDFSRSDGAGSATTRNTLGLTRSVSALMVPPLPAASRPSNTIMARKPSCLTQSCSRHSSTCSLCSSFSYSFRFILSAWARLPLPLLRASSTSAFMGLLPGAGRRADPRRRRDHALVDDVVAAVDVERLTGDQ